MAASMATRATAPAAMPAAAPGERLLPAFSAPSPLLVGHEEADGRDEVADEKEVAVAVILVELSCERRLVRLCHRRRHCPFWMLTTKAAR
ncbi:hypothetical protein VTI74DRAFT_347 [Chaetomium olivicolor]